MNFLIAHKIHEFIQTLGAVLAEDGPSRITSHRR
jgi:hypothetical protein